MRASASCNVSIVAAFPPSVVRMAGVDAAVTAARRVINALLHAGNNSAAEMNDVADKLNDVADYLETHVPSVEDRLIDMWSGEGVPRHTETSCHYIRCSHNCRPKADVGHRTPHQDFVRIHLAVDGR